jgi:hypothetical protein
MSAPASKPNTLASPGTVPAGSTATSGTGAVPLNDFRGRLGAIIDEVTTLTSNISDSYDTYLASKDKDAVLQNQMKDYVEKTHMYNRLFQEEELRNQQKGGKSRHQTLQEYVLALFFLAYAILFKSAYTYVHV